MDGSFHCDYHGYESIDGVSLDQVRWVSYMMITGDSTFALQLPKNVNSQKVF